MRSTDHQVQQSELKADDLEGNHKWPRAGNRASADVFGGPRCNYARLGARNSVAQAASFTFQEE